MINHQQKQIEVINKLEEQVKANTLGFSVVSPVEDFENDPRICLTSVHFPSDGLKNQINKLCFEMLYIKRFFIEIYTISSNI